MARKMRYKFLHSYVSDNGVKMLVWQSTTRLSYDSRVEQITCVARWFWNPAINTPEQNVYHGRSA